MNQEVVENGKEFVKSPHGITKIIAGSLSLVAGILAAASGLSGMTNSLNSFLAIMLLLAVLAIIDIILRTFSALKVEDSTLTKIDYTFCLLAASIAACVCGVLTTDLIYANSILTGFGDPGKGPVGPPDRHPDRPKYPDKEWPPFGPPDYHPAARLNPEEYPSGMDPGVLNSYLASGLANFEPEDYHIKYINAANNLLNFEDTLKIEQTFKRNAQNLEKENFETAAQNFETKVDSFDTKEDNFEKIIDNLETKDDNFSSTEKNPESNTESLETTKNAQEDNLVITEDHLKAQEDNQESKLKTLNTSEKNPETKVEATEDYPTKKDNLDYPESTLVPLNPNEKEDNSETTSVTYPKVSWYKNTLGRKEINLETANDYTRTKVDNSGLTNVNPEIKVDNLGLVNDNLETKVDNSGLANDNLETKVDNSGLANDNPGTKGDNLGLVNDNPGTKVDNPNITRDYPGTNIDNPNLATDNPGTNVDNLELGKDLEGKVDNSGLANNNPGAKVGNSELLIDNLGTKVDDSGFMTDIPGTKVDNLGLGKDLEAKVDNLGLGNVNPGSKVDNLETANDLGTKTENLRLTKDNFEKKLGIFGSKIENLIADNMPLEFPSTSDMRRAHRPIRPYWLRSESVSTKVYEREPALNSKLAEATKRLREPNNTDPKQKMKKTDDDYDDYDNFALMRDTGPPEIDFMAAINRNLAIARAGLALGYFASAAFIIVVLLRVWFVAKK